jgi:glycosyltransferase involved in cell wall biosynthesis
MTPRVTVLMSVYNGARYLREAVDSILAQTWRDFEFLIIDDGSTDASAQILASYDDARIRIIRNETNVGLTRSLNIGLAAARGALIARQDADDVSDRERLALQVAAFDADPALAILGTGFYALDDAGRIGGAPPLWPRLSGELALRWQTPFDNPFIHTSVVVRRDVVWDELGGYDEAFRTNQDFELWSRLLRTHRGANLKANLVGFRRHAASVSARYSPDLLARLTELMTRNLRDFHGLTNGAHELAEFWLTASNLHLFPEARHLARGVALLESAWTAFVAREPAAVRDREIRAHRAAMFGRLACVLPIVDRRIALRCYMRSLQLDAAMAASCTVRFVALMLMGNHKHSLRALLRPSKEQS